VSEEEKGSKAREWEQETNRILEEKNRDSGGMRQRFESPPNDSETKKAQEPSPSR
jgi:hypothetical protein